MPTSTKQFSPDSKSAGFTAVGVQVSLSVPCAFSRVYSDLTRSFCKPFFAFNTHLGTIWVQVLFTPPVFFSSFLPFSLTSILQKDAALAASYPIAANARSQGRAGLALPHPAPPFLFPPENSKRSKGHGCFSQYTPDNHRFFPASQLTGVSVGALRFWMRCSKKSENLKIVQNQHLAAQFSHLQLVSKFVSRRFSASITIYLHLHKQRLYAISLHWQCVPSHFDHMLEVAS